MKKTILPLLLSLTLAASAQNNQLSFLGISMNKTVESFYSSLIGKGFNASECGTYSGFEETKCCTGNWMGYNNCQVTVARNQEDKNLSRVMVHIKGCSSNSVKNIMDQFSKSYGDYSYETKGNGYVWRVGDGGIIVTDMSSFGTLVVSFHNKSEFDKMMPDFIELSKKEHALFKGVSMDNLNELESTLVRDGFTYIKSPNAISKLYEGTFGGVDDCYITILYTPITKRVAQVVVDYPNRDSWTKLTDDFYNAAKALIWKYGAPREDMKIEIVRPDCRGNELDCLENGSGIAYLYGWDIQGGGISLKIMPEQCVTIKYFDDSNIELFRREKANHAYDDF